MEMKVTKYNKFGSPEVMKLTRAEVPTPGGDEVRIKVHGTSVNTVDIVYRSGMKPMFGMVRLVTGIRRPKKQVLGFDVAGIVDMVGNEVKEFKVGDRVYGGARSGANAEYALAHEFKSGHFCLPSSIHSKLLLNRQDCRITHDIHYPLREDFGEYFSPYFPHHLVC